MKKLNENEIKFIKETGWTPTVQQCGEWYRTIWTDDKIDTNDPDYLKAKEQYENKYCEIAIQTALDKYNFNLMDLYNKFTDECDGISLEYEATYLFYTFFTKEELEKMTDQYATGWLKDFQYFFGYRKWDGGNITYVDEALDVYNGKRVFYLEDDGAVWNMESDHPYIQDNPELIIEVKK